MAEVLFFLKPHDKFSVKQVLSPRQLIGITGIAIGKIDYSAIFKAIFAQYVMHDYIVAMRVNAYGVCMQESPVQQMAGIALAGLCNSNAMDYMIGLIVQPRPTLDI